MVQISLFCFVCFTVFWAIVSFSYETFCFLFKSTFLGIIIFCIFPFIGSLMCEFMLTFFPFWLMFDDLLDSGHWRYEAGHLYPNKQLMLYLLTCDVFFFRSKVTFSDMAMLIMQIQCTILEQYTLTSLLYHISFAILFSFIFLKNFNLILVSKLSRIFHFGLYAFKNISFWSLYFENVRFGS